MFGMFHRNTTKTPSAQNLIWNATVAKEDGYLSLEWGKVHYNPYADTATMQWAINNLDGTSDVMVKENVTVAEVLAELAKLRNRKNLRSWNYVENTWNGNLGAALSAMQVAGSISVQPAEKKLVANITL